MSSDLLVEARNLSRRYGSTEVVSDVSFQLFRGETLGIVGESGSGKSTVARLLLRLIEPSGGKVIFHESDARTYSLFDMRLRDIRKLRRKMSIVFQDPYAALNPRMSVRHILSEPFLIHRERPSKGIEARLHELLDEVGLDSGVLNRYPHEFSGGQRQRINIARALALRPELLVLDEPVSALDVSVAAQIVNLLRDLQARYGLTCLFISHSMPLVRYLCQRVVVMQRGRIVETGTWGQVCDAPNEAYTRQLLAATPELPITAFR